MIILFSETSNYVDDDDDDDDDDSWLMVQLTCLRVFKAKGICRATLCKLQNVFSVV
jgi:hypothetical protein